MNKVYKLKFNRSTLSLDAVAEIATNAVAGSTTDNATANKEGKKSNFNRINKLIGSLLLPVTLAGVGNSYAELTGANVINGQVDIVTNGLVTTITNSNNAIIEWQTFNIGVNEIVQFIQESSSSAVLNRIVGGSISQILGTLISNGKVFIVNPAGIVFGENSVVDVGSLVASTLDITNEDFLNGNYVFNQDKDSAIASILSQGVIKVNDDGTLALVGGQVVNTGVLEAKNGTVYLLAGQSITIQDLDNPLISYKVTAENKAVNLGEIITKRAVLLANKVAVGYTSDSSFADVISSNYSANQASITASGEVIIYGASESDQVQDISFNDSQLAANISNQSGLVVVNGTINVSNASGTGGNVTVLGDQIVLENNAVINASGNTGGNVYIGGDEEGTGELKLAANTSISSGAVINVSGTDGDAGQVIAWGNIGYYDGTFLATSVNGNGGFVETSGQTLNLGDNVSVDTRSVYGNIGNWLLDPIAILVVNSSPNWTMVNNLLGTNYCSSDIINMTCSTFNDYDGNAAHPGNTYSIITTTQINRYLANTSVTLNAQNQIRFYYANISSTNANSNLNVYTNSTIFQFSNITIAGNLNIYNGTFLSISNSNISAGYINYTNGTGTVGIGSSNLTANYSINISSTGAVTLDNSTLKAAYNIALNSGTNLTIVNSNLTAGTTLLLTATNLVNLTNNASAAATATKNNFSATNINITSNNTVKLEGITLNSSSNTTISSTSTSGNVTIGNTTTSRAANLLVSGAQINITNYSVNNVTGEACFTVTANSTSTYDRLIFSNVANANFSINGGNLTLTNSTLNGNASTMGYVYFRNTATSTSNAANFILNNTTISNFSNISATRAVASQYNLTLSNSAFTNVTNVNFTLSTASNLNASNFSVNATGNYTDSFVGKNYDNTSITATNIDLTTTNSSGQNFDNATFNASNNFNATATCTSALSTYTNFSNVTIIAGNQANLNWTNTALNIASLNIAASNNATANISVIAGTTSNATSATSIDGFNISSENANASLSLVGTGTSSVATNLTLNNTNLQASENVLVSGSGASDNVSLIFTNSSFNAGSNVSVFNLNSR